MITIIDNFLPDPFTFRKWGLKAQDNETTSPHYPGKRFKVVKEEDQKVITNIIIKQFYKQNVFTQDIDIRCFILHYGFQTIINIKCI